MKALIFGIGGQDGHYLSLLLQRLGINVTGVSRSPGDWNVGTVGDFGFVEGLIRDIKPDYIFHLAANSSTRHDLLFENFETISAGTMNIMEAAYRHCPSSRIFISGSGLQFVNKGSPISERDPFDANSTYSVARIQSVYTARYYRSLGLKVYVGYFFNHDSPLRSERHVNQKIVQALKRISSGSNEKLELFDISVKKEFSFAGDIMEAVFVLVNNDSIFETVIGSGEAYTIEDWLNLCFGKYNIDWRTKVQLGKPFKKEYDILVSDPGTIQNLGWKPKHDIVDLAEMMLNGPNEG
jgi:GDPmannose 4,6-dehydratase